MTYRSPAGLAAAVLATLAAAPAAATAAPVTVDLRIEGPTRTLFEGPVTTDVRPFRFTGEAPGHRCDGTTVGGPHATPVPTRGAALAEAAERAPFALEGSWSDQYGPSFTRIAGEGVAWDGATQRYLVEYENGRPAGFGACGDDIQPGDDVLFAYATGSEPLLALSGPATAAPGGTATVRVTDAATGEGIGGASVGGARTAPDGTATVGPFATRGEHDLKADKAGTIRSNRWRVCVTDGADGACGTSLPGGPAPAPRPVPAVRDTRAPLATIAGIREQQRFRRRRAPRELRGTVTADPSGLRAVKLALTRQHGGVCRLYSGRRERFLKRRCGRRYAFKIGDTAEWSYLLPHRLRPGRYVLDAIAVDRAGNRDRLARGRSRVVFFVR